MERAGPVVLTRSLTKRYGTRILAVDSLDLEVRRGEVYGFLGPNGAGKTTTLRMLLGLTRPSSGSALVAGHPPGSPAGLARVGAMVESPAFYPYLSGHDNLRVIARYCGVDDSACERALGEVELAARAGDRFGTYSLGMKQRLGVAAALVKDPELLILDEPSNGLDPAGMVDMRNLVRSLGQDNRTVVLSSHLLSEVQQIVDRMGVIQAGRLVAEGTVAEILNRATGGGHLLVRAQPAERALELLRAWAGGAAVSSAGGGFRVAVDASRAAELNRTLVAAGVDVSELRPGERSLEEAFLELTGEAGG